MFHCQMTVNGRGYPLRSDTIAPPPTSLPPLAQLILAQQEQMQAASGHSGKHPTAMLLQERLYILQGAMAGLRLVWRLCSTTFKMIQVEQQHDAKLLAHEGKLSAAGGPREE